MFRSTALAGLALVALTLMVFTLTRAAFGSTAAAMDAPAATTPAARAEGYLFEVQLGTAECSIQSVDHVPDRTPRTVSTTSIYVYADDLYETYIALCSGSTDAVSESS